MISWLPQPWLIPTEIFPSDARAQGAAVSVVVWGFMNFAVTFLSPLLFNNLNYWIFLIFAGTNTFAGIWTWVRGSNLIRAASHTNENISYTHQKQVDARSKRMCSSSRMLLSKGRGGYIRLIRRSLYVCRRVKGSRTGNHNHC